LAEPVESEAGTTWMGCLSARSRWSHCRWFRYSTCR